MSASVEIGFDRIRYKLACAGEDFDASLWEDKGMDIMNQKPTLQLINSAEVREIEEWERLYPDKWLFIEVTRQDEWEVYEGKLIAIADDTIGFVEIGRSYRDRGISNLTTRGVYSEPQPAFIALWQETG